MPSPPTDEIGRTAALTDSFGRFHDYLRISLTERCNLRCVYCMPPEGVDLKPRADILTFEEIVRLARLFVAAGVRKIRLTGGEPLVRRDVEDLVAELGRIPGLERLAITTNGLLLEPMLGRLVAGGITEFNISLDTLRPDRFVDMTRRPGLERVLSAIDATLAAGFGPVKVNCVVMRGLNEDEVPDFVRWTTRESIAVRFIEYMPFEGNGWNRDALVPQAELVERVRAQFPDLVKLDDSPHSTSHEWKIPGAPGSVGFISSMTDAFCAGCNRLRITADGRLMVCLFASAGVSLRDAMRSGADDAALLELVRAGVGGKKASHGGMDFIARTTERPMILIGG